MALDRQQMEELKENLAKLQLSQSGGSLLMQALTNPASLDDESWKRLTECITQKAIVNMKNGRVAAKVCDVIAKCEINALYEGQKKLFRKTLLSHLQQTFKMHKHQNYQNKDSWIGFVNFLCAIFDLLRINNLPLMTLVTPVYEVLSVLTDPKFACDDLAMQCLVIQLQFIGEELDRLNTQKMNELIEKVRDLLCSDAVSQLSCLMLLEIIELRSGRWKLSSSAYQYYYEEAGAK